MIVHFKQTDGKFGVDPQNVECLRNVDGGTEITHKHGVDVVQEPYALVEAKLSIDSNLSFSSTKGYFERFGERYADGIAIYEIHYLRTRENREYKYYDFVILNSDGYQVFSTGHRKTYNRLMAYKGPFPVTLRGVPVPDSEGVTRFFDTEIEN